MNTQHQARARTLACWGAVVVLSACGGGGSSSPSNAPVPAPPPPAQSPAPVPPPPAPAPAPAPASSTTVAALQATRMTGTAPLAVMFDATATTASAGTDTFRQIAYAFNFGDDRGQTWAVSGQPKNTQAGGPLAAHVFDLPGTYTVTVRATDAAGGISTASVTITVQDPAAVYAGTQTVCVSPSANYSGCPSGAAQQTGYPTSWTGKRVLLHRGESFGDISLQDGNAGVQVGAYGSGSKPVVTTVGVGSWRPATAAFATDITVMDLNVRSGMTQCIGSRVLFYRNDVRAAAGGIAMYVGQVQYWRDSDAYRTVAQSAFHNAREIFLVENTAVGADTSASAALAQVWGDGSRVALLGNTLGRQQQHTVRFSALNRSVIAHNNIQGISADGIRHALKLHSMGTNPYADTSLNDSSGRGGWASNLIVIANNLFGHASDNNAWTVALAPQNTSVGEGLEDVIVENNRFIHGANTTTDLMRLGRRITERGNTLVGGSGRYTVSTEANDELPLSWIGPYYAN